MNTEQSVPKAKPKSAVKTKSKASTRVPTPEKYDLSRAEGPDPRDSRSQGYPCMGQHEIMAEGRGSLSGRNGHAMWKVCAVCRLRVYYAPAFGAKGTYRQAGPLAPDTDVALKKVGNTIENDTTARESLNSKVVSVIGAEESLKNKLKQLEEQRTKMTSAASTRPSQVTKDTKKAAKRESAETAEQVEATVQEGYVVIPP